MKKQYKKFVYLINDITGVLLKKDRNRDREIAHQLRIAIYILSIILLISLILNFYHVFR